MIDVAPPGTVSIRPARPEDQAFVAATFVEQLARGHCKDANLVVDRVLDSETTRVLVAIDPATGRITGWLAYAAIPRVRAVLFVYVRSKSRLQGVAHELAAAAWSSSTRPWVHAGLCGGSTKSLLQRFAATEMDLSELI